MKFYKKIIVINLMHLFVFEVVAQLPDLLVTAPQIVCSRHTGSSVARAGQSIITIETEGETDSELNITWSLRWVISQPTSQRDTLILWRKVRAIEKKLNKSIKKPTTFTIENEELVMGMSYIFNITATSINGESTKEFSINYTKDRDFDLERNVDLFSVVLQSASSIYADMECVIEAQVTNCEPKLDYYFIWSIYSEELQHRVNVTNTIGSRLKIPPYFLKPGATYEVICQVIRCDNKDIITDVKSSFQVLLRGLKVYLNVDRLIVGVNTTFILEAIVEKHDYIEDSVAYDWECFDADHVCDFFESNNNEFNNFSTRIPYKGEYKIYVTVTVLNESATANATIVTVEAEVPILQIQSTHRTINENDEIKLIGEAYNVAPSCTVAWYFAAEELKTETDRDFIEKSDVITNLVQIYSIQDKFLDELVDFTFDTKSIEVEATLTKAGRARFVATCECSNDTDCGDVTNTTLYAEVNVQLNRGPVIYNFSIFPESGTALETAFRIYSKARDTDGPLLFSFYCSIGRNETLVLASYLNHSTLDTVLPYIEGGTEIWMLVCDNLGACSKSDIKTVQLLPNSDDITDVVIRNVHGHLKRCEVLQFQRTAVLTIISFRNAGKSDLSTLTDSLLESLPDLHFRCLNDSLYFEVLSKFDAIGLKTDILCDHY